MQQENAIGTALGTVLYLRNFFLEDSFVPVLYGTGQNIRLRVLKSTTETERLAKWIKELERHQRSIRNVVLGIYSISEHPGCRGSKNAKLVEAYSLDVGKTQDFKAVCRKIQKMDPLSGRFSLRIKAYAHRSTRLRGFKKGSEAWMVEGGNKIEVSNMKILHKTVCEAVEGSTRPSDTRCNAVSSEYDRIMEVGSGGCCIQKQGTTIDCSCTINTNEKDMLQCKRCLGWVHAVCCGYFSSGDARISKDFKCLKCVGRLTKELRDRCVYRRVLYIVFNEDFSGTDLKERLKITKSLAQKILSRLRADGFVRYIKDAKKYEVVKDQESKEKIKEYFNEVECFISVGKVEHTLL